MTLDEAIKHCEEVADSHDRIKQIKAVTLEECKCAEEHRQLAEWLKELKAYREQGVDTISRQIISDKIRADVINIADGKRLMSVRSVVKIIDKYKAESEVE